MGENLGKNVGPEADGYQLARNQESSAHQNNEVHRGVAGLGQRNYLFLGQTLLKVLLTISGKI